MLKIIIPNKWITLLFYITKKSSKYSVQQWNNKIFPNFVPCILLHSKAEYCKVSCKATDQVKRNTAMWTHIPNQPCVLPWLCYNELCSLSKSLNLFMSLFPLEKTNDSDWELSSIFFYFLVFFIHAAAAAATAKSLQSCPTLCDPIDSSPPGSSIHGICQARVLEWGAIAFSNFLFI